MPDPIASREFWKTMQETMTPVDISPAFAMNAGTDYQNQKWRMVIEDEPETIWQGDVDKYGWLLQGDAPPDFQYRGGISCNAIFAVYIDFYPDPCRDCCGNIDPSGQNCCPGSDTSPNSVELATGRFIFKKELLSLGGEGAGGWNFALNYKSNFDIDGILGKGFSYPQFMHLEELGGGYTTGKVNVQLVTNQLSRAIYFQNDDGTFSPAAGNSSSSTLTVTNQFSTDEYFTLTSSDGTITTLYGFDYFNYFGGGENITNIAPGQIKSIVDRFGNRQEFTWSNSSSYLDPWWETTIYDGIPMLTSVTDSFGRQINYTYWGDENGFHLKEITDALGRKLNFQYDEYDHLVAVVTPSILKAAAGNTFSGGTAYVFQYDIGNADPLRRNDLIKIWYPNQTLPFLDSEARAVNVEGVYGNATPRYQMTYGQAIYDPNSYGKVLTETLGDPIDEVGGTATFTYVTDGLPDNLIDPPIPTPPPDPIDPEYYPTIPDPVPVGGCPIIARTIYTDRNGNRTNYDFGVAVSYIWKWEDPTFGEWSSYSVPTWQVCRLEVELNRNKNSLELAEGVSFVTWTKFNAQNQPLLIVYPEGNSVEYAYEDGDIDGLPDSYVARRGLLLSESQKPGNSLGIPSRDGSGGQTVLTKRYFHEPIFGRLCATIDERGNPVDGSTYYTPQNGGTTPTNADRSRYATLSTFDYQKDQLSTISGDATLQTLLGLDSGQIETLIAYVDSQMSAIDGSGGIPTGFPVNLGDINGDGTGDGDSSGLSAAAHLGNVVKIVHPSVRMVDGTSQERVELFTVNLRGQVTTATDPEGNLTVTTRYPENDPEGNGQNISPTLSTQQYGLVREIHRDANPDDVMTLVGASGDLADFVPGLITRTNTPGVYQDLVTRYEGSSGCAACSYDPMGNVLNETDPRGFTTIYDRNELGEVYRVTSPAPYNFRVETSYDANRNVIQVDTEDLQVQYNSEDPTAAGYGTFTPSGSGTTAHVPMIAGLGGALRPGWFSNLMSYDLLDNKVEEDIDATGSTPSNLVTRYRHDANENLIKITKPEGNTVEYDYDERDLKIAERIGYDAATNQPGAVTVYSYDGNKNLVNIIGPVDHNFEIWDAATANTAYITNAFRLGSMLTQTGDWVLQNTYDGFDRVVSAKDAVGNVVNSTYDPTSALIQNEAKGPIGGASPINRSGTSNVSLANSIMRFDEGRRLYEKQDDIFLPTGATLPSSRAATQIGGGLAANSTANDHTGTVTLTTGGTSYVLGRTVYDRAGRIVATLTDNTAQTTYSYDGENRQILATDPLGNIIATVYDGNGNPVQATRTESCTITSPTIENEIFVSFTWFDCLNRPVISGTQGADGEITADLGLCCPWQGLPSTLFSLMGYDSRGNKATVTDPKVNVLVSVFDGASRLIETQQEMRQNGDGRKAPEANQTFLTSGGGVIRTEYLYDGNSRLIELVDDRGASTVYGYDLLDRQITKTLADGSLSSKAFDLAGCLIGFTDENGSIFIFTFDAISRKVAAAITRATGVGGTTAQSFQYDGLSRQTKAVDTISASSAEVDFIYDSLGRILEEKQVYGGHTRYTTHTQWTSWLATQTTYPSSDITRTDSFDALYRKAVLSAASAAHGALDSVAWQFFGPSRIVETNYGDDSLIATQMNNARTQSAVQSGVALPAWGDQSSDRLGYDGVGRMITKRYLTGGIDSGTHAYNDSTALVGFTSSFDRASNKRYERHLHAEERSHLYQTFNSDGSLGIGYDSANRLRQYQRGGLSSATIPYRVPTGASITTPITLPGTDQIRTYGLDGLGNWKRTNYTLVTDGEGDTSDIAEMRQHNYVNEITSVRDTVDGTPATIPFVYDHGNNTDGIQGNGNLVNDGVRIYQWDAFNRLIQIKNAETDATIASYIYDALNRRISKTISDLGGGNGGLTGDIPAGTTAYLYEGQQIIEERDSGTPDAWKQVYFWGQYIDELMFFAVPTATTYRVLSDLLYRSVAIVTTGNVITEAYDTDAYGNTLCYSGPGDDDQWFTDDDVRTNAPINTTIFTGRQYDPESQIYYYRARYYDSVTGRFVSRDPIGEAGGINQYSYVGNKPVNFGDPSGLFSPGPVAPIAPPATPSWLKALGPIAPIVFFCLACPGDSQVHPQNTPDPNGNVVPKGGAKTKEQEECMALCNAIFLAEDHVCDQLPCKYRPKCHADALADLKKCLASCT